MSKAITDGYERVEREISPLALVSFLLRSRRIIGWMAVSGAMIGLASGLLRHRQYESSATFLTQGSEAALSGLSGAANALFGTGPQTPGAGGAWGPSLY